MRKSSQCRDMNKPCNPAVRSGAIGLDGAWVVSSRVLSSSLSALRLRRRCHRASWSIPETTLIVAAGGRWRCSAPLCPVATVRQATSGYTVVRIPARAGRASHQICFRACARAATQTKAKVPMWEKCSSEATHCGVVLSDECVIGTSYWPRHSSIMQGEGAAESRSECRR